MSPSTSLFDEILAGLDKEEKAVRALHKAGRITMQRGNGHLDGIAGARSVVARVRARHTSNDRFHGREGSEAE